MEKEKNLKRVVVALGAAVAVFISIFAFVLVSASKGEAYRSVKIVEVKGDVSIERENIGKLQASVNMNLLSGDYLSTSEDAYVVLRLDSDKYVMLGECGAMAVTAEGNDTSGRTSIKLEAGSVLSEIQNPLGADSAYDVVTPYATMSVRGTVFEVRMNENDGDGTVTVLVYDGCVAVGLEGKEPVLYTEGEYTEFTRGTSPQFLIERGSITEEQIDAQMLWRLQQIEEQGRNINMGKAGSGTMGTLENNMASQDPDVSAEGATTPGTGEMASSTAAPTQTATAKPAQSPTAAPAQTPTAKPAQSPTATPAQASTARPAQSPTATPAQTPTAKPAQSPAITPVPDGVPAMPDGGTGAVGNESNSAAGEDSEPIPSAAPTVTQRPAPSVAPTAAPTPTYTPVPSAAPTVTQMPAPSAAPTATPTSAPSVTPTATYTPVPSATATPTPVPSAAPTPTRRPTPTPSVTHTPAPSVAPTATPTATPTESPAPEQEVTIKCYLPYIASINDKGSIVYSDIKDVEPYLYWRKEVTIGSTVQDKPADPSIYTTPKGGQDGNTDITFVGWCTKDGQVWDLDNDIVQEDMSIYPVWEDSNGNKYYPAFFDATQLGFECCNSVRDNSTAVYNDVVIE